MTQIEIPSGTLEYVEKGRGAPLILLHGGTGNIEEWGGCVEGFARRYRVIAYNRRGYGNASPRYDYPPDFFYEDVHDLAALMDALGVETPAYICGFSDGATIALLFAVRYPERVRAMVCCGAHIYVDEKTPPGLSKVKQLFEDRAVRQGLEGSSQTRSQQAWFDRWLDPHFAASFDISQEISRIRCPVLIVQGLEDEFAEPVHAERIASRIQGSRLWFVEGARHWVHRGRNADLFVERALSFFAGTRAEYEQDNGLVGFKRGDQTQGKGVS